MVGKTIRDKIGDQNNFWPDVLAVANDLNGMIAHTSHGSRDVVELQPIGLAI